MAKDKLDFDTEDWVDDSEERRLKEEQAHARRQARKAKQAIMHKDAVDLQQTSIDRRMANPTQSRVRL